MSTPNGFLLLNKTPGPTTFRILGPLKRHFRKIKIGHAGTLDSEASGLVIVAIGSATRLLQYAEAADKKYTFDWCPGKSTVTGEAGGEIVEETKEFSITQKQFLQALEPLRGEISQTPPLYSAVKIDGKRASDRVRAGETIELKSRKVQIFELKPLGEMASEITEQKIFVHCSKGTYVRSLGRDLGKNLGIPACVKNIHRIAIGPWELRDAISWEWTEEDLKLIPPEVFFGNFPTYEMSVTQALRVNNGNPIEVDAQDGMAFVRSEGENFAQAFGQIEANIFRPKVVFQ